MSSALITDHPLLITLARRVKARWLLESIRTGMSWAVPGAATLTLAGRLTDFPEWKAAVLLWVALALAVSVLAALRHWPNSWAVAVAADGLGMEERVASALHAARVAHPAATLLDADARKALAKLNPSDYALLPPGSIRRAEAAMIALLAVAVLVPLPILGDGSRQAAEGRTVASARQSLQSLEARLKSQPEPLAQTAAQELKASEDRLAEARSAAEAARILEQAQERLADQGKAEDYAWQRAMEGLTTSWNQSPEMVGVARAISAGDEKAAEDALGELARRAEGMSPDEQAALKLALQAGANASRDVPALSGALREAAGQVSQDSEDGQSGTARAMQEAADQIAQGIERSTGLQAVQQAVAGLGQARAGLGQVAGSASGASAATGGSPSGSASSGQVPTGGSSAGPGAGSGAAAGAGTGSGTSSGAGAAGAAGPGSGTGSGAGTAGGSGGGAGAGAGAGGGPSGGRPNSGNPGATMAGGYATPNVRGAAAYESIYAPNLLGGSGGPRVQTSGGAQGSDGNTVELPNSPVELGSIRPYDEVYGQYEEAARQSLSRQPLPPALQGVVQRYFSSIAPESK